MTHNRGERGAQKQVVLPRESFFTETLRGTKGCSYYGLVSVQLSASQIMWYWHKTLDMYIVSMYVAQS